MNARSCGDCGLCCRVLPIGEIGKKFGEPCGYHKFKKGCTLHGTPSKPESCRRWSCWWLLDPQFDLPRPDRAGYVVDMMPDFVVFGDDVLTGKRVDALQIWADTKRPEAWRGAVDWIKRVIGKKQAVAVIRFSSTEAVTLVPPCLTDTGEWAEIDSRVMGGVHADTVRRLKIEEDVAQTMSVSREVSPEAEDDRKPV